METLFFDIARMDRVSFFSLPEKDGKRWSYSSVYFLRDLKDIFLLYAQNESLHTISDLYNICRLNGIESENKKDWTPRNLLELVNALKNFELLDKKTNRPVNPDIFQSGINEPLTEHDQEVFKDIYFSYFRFKEFHALFETQGEQPALLFAYMEDSRFFNRFIRLDINKIYCIETVRNDVMRFWDVYTKWGTSLGVLNKCSLAGLGVETIDEEMKNAYVLNLSVDIPSDFSVLGFMEQEIGENYVYIPTLEWKLISHFGYAIDSIKKKLVNECEMRSSEYRLQRTSAILVESNERNLLPELNNSYMSHILKM